MIDSCTLRTQHHFRENVHSEPHGETKGCITPCLREGLLFQCHVLSAKERHYRRWQCVCRPSFRGFDPQDVGNGNKENPLFVLHHEAFQRAEITEGLEQWFETSICFPALFEDLACVNQALGKCSLSYGFKR